MICQLYAITMKGKTIATNIIFVNFECELGYAMTVYYILEVKQVILSNVDLNLFQLDLIPLFFCSTFHVNLECN